MDMGVGLVSVSLVCAYGSQASPSGSPCDLAQPNTHCPSGCSQTFQAHSPLAAPRGPTPPSPPAHLHFLCQEPLPPKIPPRLRPEVSRLKVILFLRGISSKPSCWAGPGFPQGLGGPASWCWPLEMSCGCNLELVGDREFSQLGQAGATGRRAEPRLPPVPARPGWEGNHGRSGIETSSEALRWGGASGVQPRGAGPRLSRSPGQRPGAAPCLCHPIAQILLAAVHFHLQDPKD